MTHSPEKQTSGSPEEQSSGSPEEESSGSPQEQSSAGLGSVLRAGASGQRDLRLETLTLREVRWAIAAGFGPLLDHVTADDVERRAHPGFEAIRASDLTARVLYAETVDVVERLLAASEAGGIEVTLLKGIAWGDELYPEPHHRPMADVDLLVDRDDVDRLEAILVDNGFERRSNYPLDFYDDHHHSCPFHRPDSGDWVEVHTALFPPSTAIGDDELFAPSRLATERRPSRFRGRSVARLNPEYELVYLATHWAFELDPRGALMPMLDSMLLLRRHPDLDWDRIIGWLDRSVAAPHVVLLLSFLAARKLIDSRSLPLDRLLRTQRTLTGTSLRLAHHLLQRYALEGVPFGRWMTSRNFDVIWATLLRPRRSIRNLLALPGRLVPDRFRPGAASSGSR